MTPTIWCAVPTSADMLLLLLLLLLLLQAPSLAYPSCPSLEPSLCHQ
jgi:hypothetical protein